MPQRPIIHCWIFLFICPSAQGLRLHYRYYHEFFLHSVTVLISFISCFLPSGTRTWHLMASECPKRVGYRNKLHELIAWREGGLLRIGVSLGEEGREPSRQSLFWLLLPHRHPVTQLWIMLLVWRDHPLTESGVFPWPCISLVIYLILHFLNDLAGRTSSRLDVPV